MGSSLLLKGGTSTPKNIVESFSQANNFSVGDAIRYDIPSSTWVKAQADSAENSEVAGVVSAASFNTFDLTYAGLILVSALSGVSAPVLFLDSTTAGGLTSSPPSAIGSVIKPVLTKTTNGSGYIVTNYLGTQIGGSSTVAIDEIQPVGTVVPFAGSVIPDSWLECNGNSYAVGSYPYLYSKLQYTSGDRVPLYGHIAVLTTTTAVAASNIGTFINQGSTDATTVRAKIIAVTATTITVQTVPFYSFTTKNLVINNTVFAPGNILISGGSSDGNVVGTITAVSITHFNTPDLRGRVALGVNTTAIADTDGEFPTNLINSAIANTYSLGSVGGQESTIANTGVGAVGTAPFVTSVSTSGGLIANLPPYTVVRYIIKASPYTRAAIIDGIDIPYTSLLVGDLRDGTLRPGGIGEALVFKTNDGSSGTERMRLTNAGNLGIGTTTPQYKFVVSNSGAEGFEFIPANALNENIIQSYNRSGAVFNTLDFRASNYRIRSSNTEVISINSSGQVNIAATTNSTSLSTGGLTLGGGLGMALNLTVGGGISAAGGITFSNLTRVTNTTAATSPTVAAFTVAGGIGIATNVIVGDGISAAGGITFSGITRVTNGTPATSTSVAALTVAGGVGIGGALYVGGITTAGGISMGGALTVGGGITAATLDCSGQVKSGSISTGTFTATSLAASSGTDSTATNIGALTVVGGAGIGKNLYVGGGITAAGSLDLGSGAIKTSGSLDCGNITSSGTFSATTLSATNTAASTNTANGAIVVAGGVGIAKNLIVGDGISAAGGITFSGITRVTNATSATSTSVAALTVAGGVGIAGGLYVAGITTAGGITMGGALNVGGVTNITNASTSNSVSSGALVVAGGVGIGGSLFANAITTQTLSAESTTASSNTSTGALVVKGGVGIVKNMTLGQGISAGGAITTADKIGVGSVSIAPIAALDINGSGQQIWIRSGAGGAITGATTGLKLEMSGLTANIQAFDYTATTGTAKSLQLNSTGGGVFVGDGTAASTSTTTGALVVKGGLGVSGALYVGGITTAGALNAGTLNVSSLSTLTRLSVFNGSTDLYGNSYTIAARATTLGTTNNGGVIGTTNNQQIYGILGLDNTYAVYANGPILSTANITAFSDIRNKENISTIENGLSKTLALNGVLYTDKETQQRRTGLIAQDVLAVLPEAVHTTADGYYSLAYGNLVGLLVQAIKELNAKVDSLSAKVETLSSGGSE